MKNIIYLGFILCVWCIKPKLFASDTALPAAVEKHYMVGIAEAELHSLEAVFGLPTEGLQTPESRRQLRAKIHAALESEGEVIRDGDWSWSLTTHLPNTVATLRRCGLEVVATGAGAQGAIPLRTMTRSCHAEESTFAICLIDIPYGEYRLRSKRLREPNIRELKGLHFYIRSITRHTDHIEKSFMQNVLRTNLLRHIGGPGSCKM